MRHGCPGPCLLLALLTACSTEPEIVTVDSQAAKAGSTSTAPSPLEAPVAKGRSAAVGGDGPARESMTRGRAAPAPEPATTIQAKPTVAVPADARPEVAAAPGATAPPGEEPLRTNTPWCRPQGPVSVTVSGKALAGPLSLVVIDRDGRALADLSVIPGEMNLLALVPSLRDIDRTVWVQLMQGETPVGAPLWITPMRAPPAVRTVTSIRASNQQPYTRVVGWGDRALDPADPETAQAMPAWRPPDAVVTGGFRVTLARDALLHTSLGDMRVVLAPDAAPATVENFLRLAQAGYYDGTSFHRVVPLDREGRPFVVQGGDPTGTGDGGPGWNLGLEPSDLRHDRGVLGMARGDDPDSAGSQFYVSLSREGTARLDGQYCTFGCLADGWSTLDAIAATPIGDAATGRPKEPPVLDRVELVPAAPRKPGASARPAISPSSAAPAP